MDSSFKYDKGEIHTKSSQTVTFGGIIQEDSRIEGEEYEGHGRIQTEITEQGDDGATTTDGTRQRLSK